MMLVVVYDVLSAERRNSRRQKCSVMYSFCGPAWLFPSRRTSAGILLRMMDLFPHSLHNTCKDQAIATIMPVYLGGLFASDSAFHCYVARVVRLKTSSRWAH